MTSQTHNQTNNFQKDVHGTVVGGSGSNCSNKVEDVMTLAKFFSSSSYQENILKNATEKENIEKSKSSSIVSKFESKMPKDNIDNKAALLCGIDKEMMNHYMIDSSNAIGAEASRQERLSKNREEAKQRENESNDEFEERRALKEHANDKRNYPLADKTCINGDDILSTPLFDAAGSVSPLYFRTDAYDDNGNGDIDIDMADNGKEKTKSKTKENGKEQEKEKGKENIKAGGTGARDIKQNEMKESDYINYQKIKNTCKKGYNVVSSSNVRDKAIEFNNCDKDKLKSPFPYRHQNAFGMSQEDNSQLHSNEINNVSQFKKACISDPRLRRMSRMIPSQSTTSSAGADSAPNSNINEPRDSMPMFNQCK